MPPKKGGKRHPPPKKKGGGGGKPRSKKHDHEDSDDDLLDQLVAKNELLASLPHSAGAAVSDGSAPIPSSQIPVGQHQNVDRCDDEITAEEEARRVKEAMALRCLAMEHQELMKKKQKEASKTNDESKKKLLRKEQQAACLDCEKLLVKATVALAGTTLTNSQNVCIPDVFAKADDELLTPKLRVAAENVFLTLLRGRSAFSNPRFMATVARILVSFSPTCWEGAEIGGMIAEERHDLAQARYLFRVVRDHTPDRLIRKRMETRLVELDKSLDQIDHQLNNDEQCVCPICLGDVIDPVHPDSCSHIFCYKCLSDSMEHQQREEEQNPRCSICRASFSRFVCLSYVPILKNCSLRLQEDINDPVAWYNLALLTYRCDLKLPAPEELDDHDPLKNVLENVRATEVGLNTMALRLAIEAVRRGAHVVPESWLLLSSIFAVNNAICALQLFFIEYDLGQEYGKMNLLQVVTKALNVAEELRLSPKVMVLCNPWVDVAELLCHHEHRVDIQLNRFTITVNGRTMNPLELLDESVKKSVFAKYRESILPRLLFIHYLLYSGADENATVGPSVGDYFISGMQYAASFDVMEYYFLAKSWRMFHVLNIADSIADRCNITQEELWGRAIEDAPNVRGKSIIARNMLQHEKALVGGKLMGMLDLHPHLAELIAERDVTLICHLDSYS